jgi:hypothetical protein
VREGDLLLATTRGEIFALDPSTGGVLWNNPLRGYGYGLITIAGDTQTSSMAEHLSREQAQASAAAAAAT